MFLRLLSRSDGWIGRVVRSFPVALVLVVAGLAAGVGVSHGASAAGPALVAAPREVGAPSSASG